MTEPTEPTEPTRPTGPTGPRTAVVTGATGGIGSALVRELTALGHRVFAVARPGPRLDALCAQLPGAVPVPMDLAGPVTVPAPLSDATRVDVLVHCAGVADVAAVADAAPDHWRRTFAVNVVAPAELTRHLLPALRAARGRVVFVNMAPGMAAVPRWAAYVGSKTALRELADSLREEERGNGVTVTTVYPGPTATDLLADVREQFGRPHDPGRCLRPEALAAAVVATLDTPGGAYLPELTVALAPSAEQGAGHRVGHDAEQHPA
jgi:short-subunit dehydrogenase